MKKQPGALERLVGNIDKLEPLPVTAQKILEHVRGGDVSIAEIARIVEFDQAVAANVLRYAGSAKFMGYDSPSSMAEAIARMGTVPLLDLILGDYLRRVMGAAPLYHLTEEELWKHGAASRLAAMAIADECPNSEVPPIACTAALVHDIGKVIMARTLDARPEDVLRHAAVRRITFVEAEHEMFGIDHARVGAAIARKWKFPPLVEDAIARHHEEPIESPTLMLDVVVVANYVAKSLGVGLGAEGFNFPMDPPVCARLGLDFDLLSRVCLQTEQMLVELEQGNGGARRDPGGSEDHRTRRAA